MVTGRLQILISLGAVAVLLTVLVSALLSYQLDASDFATYLQAANTVRHGGDPFLPVVSWITHYAGGELRAEYYVYTPAFAGMLIPFTVLPLQVALAVWGLCNILFLNTSIWCILRAMGRRPVAWQVLASAAALVLLQPIKYELLWGQADLLLTALVSASFLAARSNRPVLAGLLLALAAITKPPVLLLLFFYGWKCEWRLVLTAFFGFLTLVLLPFAIIGTQALHHQVAIWRFWSQSYSPFLDNIAPRGVLVRLFTHTPYGPGILNSPLLATVVWAALVAMLGLVAVTMISRRALRADDAVLAEFGLMICIICLTSPLTEWIYLTLLTIPLVIWTSNWPAWFHGSVDRVEVVAVIIYASLCLPLQRFEGRAWSGMASGGLQQMFFVFYGAAFLYPLIAAFVLAVVVLHKRTGRAAWNRATVTR
jgi:hypothetical protein